MDSKTKIWSQQVTIPTYGIGEPNRNPMFLEKRVYQGSSGVVYPHPVIDKVDDEKGDREWLGLFLENKWLKVLILPELGGRVQMALDKTNDYHFVYHNQVIKPALVGLCGPWISGGIEFNWPQHHRPSTYSPVNWSLEEQEDGSATIWCSEIEQMFRTKGMIGFRLYPNKAYLELNVQLYNRTSEPQTFLWWANPAVAANDNYQSVFPPDVHAVMDHGKRDVSDFPIATGEYYKMDYSPGTDISHYENIPVPTSYMAYHSDYNFVGCYDYGKEAGMMHVANHHLVPGKKQWTWGNGEFGQAWDRQLTDEDGPYIELMCGAFTDNQPDFSWLMPGEEKCFSQIFMPYKEIGDASNASKDVVLRLKHKNGQAQIGVYATSSRQVTVQLLYHAPLSGSFHNHKNMELPVIYPAVPKDAVELYKKQCELSPEKTLLDEVRLPENCQLQELTLLVLGENGQELLRYTAPPEETPDIPKPATPAKDPADISSVEELFLNGQHIEQYRHATYRPEPFYEEALRRDSGDSRSNNAMGLLLFRRGKFLEAETYFRTAIQRLTLRNPNPYDGEPYHNLGLALKFQGRYDEAFDAFYKAVWNDAWQGAAFFELARIAARRGEFEEAFSLTTNSLQRKGRHHSARHLRVATLRHLGRYQEAKEAAEKALNFDRFNLGVLYEIELLKKDNHVLESPAILKTFDDAVGEDPNDRIEIALDYIHAGLFEEAIALLEDSSAGNGLVKYFLGWAQALAGNEKAAQQIFQDAAQQDRSYAFAHRLECLPALEAAMLRNSDDAFAPYALGNFWYGHRRYDEGIAAWEKSRAIDPSFPTVWRNLGLAYMNKRNDSKAAQEALEKAFSLDQTDPRVLFELDQLYKKTNRNPSERLDFLEKYDALTRDRNDLLIERITLTNLVGRFQDALDMLLSQNFHPWEGGEGKTTAQYVLSLIQISCQEIANGEAEKAVENLISARTDPPNLAESKLTGAQENNIFYYLGLAYEKLGQEKDMQVAFLRASEGLSEPSGAVYYNDQPPEMIFYQGLAKRKLGQEKEAQKIFRKLINYGKTHLKDKVQMDYFAVSLPDFLVFDEDLDSKNKVHCFYMMALGFLGLNELEKSITYIKQIRTLQADHPSTIKLLIATP